MNSKYNNAFSSILKNAFSQPILPPPQPVETDRDFAIREVDSGKYNYALNEVNTYPVLKTLFLNKLRENNQRLYQVDLINSLHSRFSIAMMLFSWNVFVAEANAVKCIFDDL